MIKKTKAAPTIVVFHLSEQTSSEVRRANCMKESIKLKLPTLLNDSPIVIQCHDTPDADAIASGFALYDYFLSKGKSVTLVYSGPNTIDKPNLLLMINTLDIPLQQVAHEHNEGLLITVDCQFGAGNVSPLRGTPDNVVIIDHHRQEIFDIPRSEIHPKLGCCATLVWTLLSEDKSYAIPANVETALYYGLLTDTNNLSEIGHPSDKDMLDSLAPDLSLINRMKSANITLADMETAGLALLRTSHNAAFNYSVTAVKPCDPNILGFISDLAIQVDAVSSCVVFNTINQGIKFSVRSCIQDVMANEMAAFIAADVGSGGGHVSKAGGFIAESALRLKEPTLSAEAFLLKRVHQYFTGFDIINSRSHNLDTEAMSRYQKRPVTLGYVPTLALAESGSEIRVRTLEGDVDILASDDVYIMIGIQGEVYPIERAVFDASYDTTDAPITLIAEYIPRVYLNASEQNFEILERAMGCIANSRVCVLATPTEKPTKVFTKWHDAGYFAGQPGDYLVMKESDPNDVYLVKGDIFDRLYEAC